MRLPPHEVGDEFVGDDGGKCLRLETMDECASDAVNCSSMCADSPVEPAGSSSAAANPFSQLESELFGRMPSSCEDVENHGLFRV
jgi:hypothetical protein